MSAFFTGFSISISLILAIGAQNTFVLRQGIRRQHIGLVILFCAFSDAILILAGVYGAGELIKRAKWLEPLMIWAGIAFLVFYALTRFYAAFKGAYELNISGESVQTRRAALLACAGFTYLNPHVYLDTFVLMGSLAIPYAGAEKLSFAIGAALASFVFFTSLGLGAKLLTPVFQNPRAWRVLDGVIGVFMLALAYSLYRNYMG